MKQLFSLYAAGLTLTLALAGCGGGGGDKVAEPVTPTVPAVPDTISLQKIDTVVGAGAEAVVGSNVSVHYTGYLYDASKTSFKGATFDSSVGRSPLDFKVGGGGIITGFDEGVKGMKVGGKRTVLIPASMGYGNVAVSAIPANSNLVFDIELVSVK